MATLISSALTLLPSCLASIGVGYVLGRANSPEATPPSVQTETADITLSHKVEAIAAALARRDQAFEDVVEKAIGLERRCDSLTRSITNLDELLVQLAGGLEDRIVMLEKAEPATLEWPTAHTAKLEELAAALEADRDGFTRNIEEVRTTAGDATARLAAAEEQLKRHGKAFEALQNLPIAQVGSELAAIRDNQKRLEQAVIELANEVSGFAVGSVQAWAPPVPPQKPMAPAEGTLYFSESTPEARESPGEFSGNRNVGGVGFPLNSPGGFPLENSMGPFVPMTPQEALDRLRAR